MTSGRYIRTKEHCDNLSKALKGKKQPNISKAHLGMKLSKEACKKISSAKLGIKLSKEHCLAISKAMLGKKRPNISAALIGKKHSKEWCKNISKGNFGRKCPSTTGDNNPSKRLEVRKKISKRLLGKKFTKEHLNNMKLSYLIGNRNDAGFVYNKCYYDGKCYKSGYESCFAKFLDYNNIKFEYESKKCRRLMDNGHIYIIDFYLIDYNLFVEIKGYYDEKSKLKIVWAKKNIPNYIIIDGNTIKYFDIEKYPESKEALKILTKK